MDVLKALSVIQGGLPFPSIAVLLVCHAAFNLSLGDLHIIEYVLDDLIKANLLVVSVREALLGQSTGLVSL